MPLVSLVHLVCHLGTDHIGFLPIPVPQSHVVDPHNRIFRPVLDNNTFFHAETAENRLPTVPGASVHEKDFYIQLLGHFGLKFNQEVTWPMRSTDHVTIPIDTLTFQSPVNNIHINLMTWIILVQKPRGNILTEFLRITVSRMVDARHVPQ